MAIATEEQQGVGEGHPPNIESCPTHYEGARVQQQEPHLELGYGSPSKKAGPSKETRILGGFGHNVPRF